MLPPVDWSINTIGDNVMTAADAYAALLHRSKEIGIIQSCAALLSWDQQTYMPVKGTLWRSEQISYLSTLAHEKLTDPQVGQWLAQVESSELMADPEGEAAANVREWRRSYNRATRVPASLVAELARVTTAAQQAWQDAKLRNDFPGFQPHLEKIVRLKKEEAQAIGYSQHPYDALLDEYEPGATTKDVRILFDNLAQQLVPLVKIWSGSQRRPDCGILQRDYPVDRQRIFAESAAAALGFDFAAGRLDVTAHPFCSGIGPGDCRITTRYNPRYFSEAFFGVLHETGHALYEMHLPAEHAGTPLGTACSLGIHESQSRLWENQVGRSRPFWEHFFPRLQQTFPAALADVSLDDFYLAINEVRPSLIRVEADEVTYNLHIIVRFELETALLTGDLPVADLPAAWRQAMDKYLGVVPPDDSRGCLQDIHWSFGGIGYFPTYTLGNLYAAQFMAAARQQLGAEQLQQDFRNGRFDRLREWLVHHIHRHGQRYRAQELCRRVTGQPLCPEPFLQYLRDKYEPLYGS
ncbi:MAG: carboxypeptidase M32 [Gemmataceae bacterium]|nr:carboxypeptidase M32 [Gemmataceae bacterium]